MRVNVLLQDTEWAAIERAIRRRFPAGGLSQSAMVRVLALDAARMINGAKDEVPSARGQEQ